jgi:hypothetical protein
MKKILTLAAIFVLTLSGLFAQQTVQIGTGTADANYLINQSWRSTFTQTIYMADMLPPVMDIREIAYEYVGTDTRPKLIKIWFSTTTEDDINGKWVTTESNKQLVFDGAINRTPPADGQESIWLTLTLDNPYLYTKDNLVITTSTANMNTGQTTHFRVSPAPGGKFVTSAYRTGSSSEPINIETRDPESFNNFLNIKLTYQTPEGRVFTVTPRVLEFPEQLINTTETKSVTLANAGTGTITVSGVNISGYDPIFTNNTTFPIVLNAGASQQVNFDFSPDVQRSFTETATFTIEEDAYFGNNAFTLRGSARDFVMLGTRCRIAAEPPVHPMDIGPLSQHRYTATQYIIPRQDIGTDITGRIRRIGFNAARPATSHNKIAIYLKNTQEESFLSSAPLTRIIPAGEMTKVFEGPYMFNQEGWNYIHTDEPFLYDGTSNLLVFVVQLEATTSNITQFYAAERPFPTGGANARTALISVQHQNTLPTNPWNQYDPTTPHTPISNLQVRSNNWVPEICFVFEEIPDEPNIFTDKKLLDFQEQEMNTFGNIIPVTVRNYGFGDMIITGVAFTSEDFYVVDATFPITIPFEGEHTINFAVTPLQLGLKTGRATFQFETPTLGNPFIDLSVFGLHYLALREGFEEVFFPPVGWRVIDADNDGSTWIRYAQGLNTTLIPPEGIGMASGPWAGSRGLSDIRDDWFITPKMKYATGDVFSFYLGGNNGTGRIYIKMSKTGNNIADFTQTIDYPVNNSELRFVNYVYDLSEYGLKDGEEFYIAFQAMSNRGNTLPILDWFRGSAKVMPNNDLMIQSFTMQDGIFNVDTLRTYSAMVANAGINTIAGGDYTVELCHYDNLNNAVVLASVPGQTLKRDEFYTVSFDHAFTDPGKYRVFMRVVYADENTGNNTSNSLVSDILPASVEFVRSGTITNQVGALPVYFNVSGLMGSICQTYYPQEHFNGHIGIIEKFRYYIDCPVSRPNRDIRIWMQNSTLPSFGEGTTLPNANEMMLVFDGKLTFPIAHIPYQPLEIELHNPFTYTGENLILMIEYNGGTGSDINPGVHFIVNSNRSSFWRMFGGGDVDNINGSSLSPYPLAPVTSFYIDKIEGLGALSGQVVYNETMLPTAGARVAITSATYPKMNAVIHTDATGNFSFPKIFAANDLKITVSKFGFLDAVVEGINLAIGGTVTVPPIQLSARPRIAVSGRVMTSDRQEPLQGATVKLFGMEDYTTTTDADGIFTFNDVWTNSSYRLEIEHNDYQKLTSTAQVLNAAINLGDFTVLQIPHRVNAVTATELDNNSVELTWRAPLAYYPKVFRRDDGNIVGPLTLTDPHPQVAVGPAFHENGIIEKVMWFQPFFSDVVVTDTIDIVLFGLNPNGTPNYQDILGRFTNIGTRPNQWNEYVLPTQVTATNGFMVGLAGVNRSTMVFIYDQGNHPDWRWQPNTMWAVFDFLGGDEPSAWAIEQLTNMPANLLIRAEGIWTGDFVPRGNAPALAGIIEETTKEKPRMLTMAMPELTEGYLTEMPEEPLRMLETILRTDRLPATSAEWLAENQKLISEIAGADVHVRTKFDTEFGTDYKSAPAAKSATPLPPIGYNIYRADLSTNSTFVRINTAGPVTVTTFTDPEYATLGRGRYQYAVTALYVGGLESARSLSNIIDRDVTISGQLNVTHNATGHPLSLINGASLLLVDNTTRTQYTGTLDNTGIISLAGVYRGIYTLTINATGFEPYRNTALDFTTSETVYTVDIELKEAIVKPYWLSIKPEQPHTEIGSVADFSWNPIPFFDGAENHANFAINNIENWTMHDIMGGDVAYILNHSWPNLGVPQAFTIFNPALTSPRLTTLQGMNFLPYEGQKYFMSWRTYGATVLTDNWMVSKEFDFDMPFEFSFYVAATRFSEEFQVAYSLGSDNWRHFITIGGTRRVNSTNWQKVTVTIPVEAKRVAIRHMNADVALRVDNITIGIPAQETKTFKHYEVYLDDRFVAQTTDVDFQFTELRNGIRTAGVVAVYSSGKSDMSTIEFEVTNGLENKFYVDVAEPENGTIVVKDPAGTEIPEGTLIDGGTTITITAVPEYGYRPLLVTVDGTPFVSGQSMTITKDLLVSATFEIRTYEITFNPNGGTGTMSPQGFTYGVAQNLTPNGFTAPTDMYFNGWAYSPTGDIVYSDQAEYFATENKTLYAIWNDNPVVVCTITLSANPTIGGTVSGGGNHNQGMEATARATANTGYRFVNWTEGTTEVSTEANYTFTVTGDRTLVANFVQFFRVNITTPTNGTIAVKVSGVDVNHGDEFDHGTELTLLATPAENYEFVRWAHDNHNQPMHSHTLTNHVTISAVFRLIPSSIQTTEKEILTIYPNPVKDELNIQTEQVIRQIFVFDLSGKIMMNLQGNHRTINMQTIPIGNYIMRIHTENAIIPVRIVKQ